ncbi:MAG: hypothetical protein ACMV1K_01410 [Sulfurospirillum sp.]
MSIDTTDLKTLYKLFNDDAFTKLQEFQKEIQIEDEYLATVLGATVQASISGSINALELYKRMELMDEDKENKIQTNLTLVAKRVRELGATVGTDGELVYSSDMSSYIENQIDLVKKQILKVAQDTTFVIKQGANMDLQVRHNCIIQGMDAAQGYNLGIGNAGLIPSQDMHTNFFIQNKALMLNAGISFDENGLATLKPDNKDTVINLGTYKVDVTMPTEAS